MNQNITFGSVCSGIEAAQLALNPIGFNQLWSSEIADFPCKVLNFHYPEIPNIGDMNKVSNLILLGEQPAPDFFCGGTPCQAFSLAGWKSGLDDERGRLTMTFIEIANSIDIVRARENKKSAIVLWENVEGVLRDKTNAFGNFIAGLAGYDEAFKQTKWEKSGFVFGRTRNVAWRVLDAKYFGLPQQRRRLYVLAGGLDFRPDQILFELDRKNILNGYNVKKPKMRNQKSPSLFDFNEESIDDNHRNIVMKDNIKFEFFREYTDCLYSAYGTKWNGNAAAYNGSLYIAQNDRVRRLTPVECERLMGIPDNYTLVNGNSDTNRYQAVGNSWAVPVIRWIGERIKNYMNQSEGNDYLNWMKCISEEKSMNHSKVFMLKDGVLQLGQNMYLNASVIQNKPQVANLADIVQSQNVPPKLYLSPQACLGILRRKYERNINMNPNLQILMERISSQE